MIKIIQTAFLILACNGWICAQDLTIGSFQGKWEVDFDRTMEAGKASPKFDAAAAEKLPEMIRRMMETMKIKVTSADMTYLRGGREIVIPLEVKEADEKTVTTTVRQGDDEVTIVFTLIDGEFMNFKSSASDDMHFYIWKKSVEPASEETSR